MNNFTSTSLAPASLLLHESGRSQQLLSLLIIFGWAIGYALRLCIHSGDLYRARDRARLECSLCVNWMPSEFIVIRRVVCVWEWWLIAVSGIYYCWSAISPHFVFARYHVGRSKFRTVTTLWHKISVAQLLNTQIPAYAQHCRRLAGVECHIEQTNVKASQ